MARSNGGFRRALERLRAKDREARAAAEQATVKGLEALHEATAPQRAEEERAVRELGDAIGYGRVMRLCEQIWNVKQPGGAHSVGPCVASLVPCLCARDQRHRCDWCCGSGRLTKRVAQAFAAARGGA